MKTASDKVLGTFGYSVASVHLAVWLCAAALLCVLAIACEKPAPVQVPPPVPVEVAQASLADIPLEIHAIGTVEAVESVAVSAQVGGYLQDVLIREGQSVKEGQPLFKIDSRKFELALKQNEAALEQTKVQWKSAVKEAERAAALLAEGAVTPQESDKLKATADTLEAAIKVQEAAIENIRLDLSFCTVRAPVTGRAGALLVHKGDLIKSGNTVFVSINKIDPINVRFSIPEKELPALRAAAGGQELKVSAALPQNDNQTVEGRLVFIDNAVDVQTGSIILKAEFANASEALWPGQFAQVRLELGSVKDALVIPSMAVQTGQQGTFVFIVSADNKSEIRRIVTGAEYNGVTIVNSGLKPGETVVTDGQIRLGNGMAVKIRKARAESREKSE